ncbi:hypothetical protein [Saccharopolyspora phatthalungensis]|uniref:Uncharacterized protein n=1 Tax=Saccharopolyspora phatthalungensis TaxID=664693 RepID=A0A840QGI3_9PSEU|nr:hypothetical protein [Saccharopolyspora phatthalungensis]MBB5157729.1 hypothetical protein [Saccharopolyspora phatthalungensis]
MMDDIEFMDRVEALIQAITKRSSGKLGSSLSEDTHAGEHTLALDSLAWSLAHEKIPISRAESAELRELLYDHELPVPYMHSINDRDNIMSSLNIIDDEPAKDEAEFYVGPPIVVHEKPDFARTLRTQVGVHVDLPVSLYDPFVDHFTTDVGVGAEVNVARTNPDQYMRTGKIHKPSAEEILFTSELVRLVGSSSIWGGGILLRSFEQWWVKDRIEAESLVSDLPRMMLSARATSKTFHVALADLSQSTVDQVLAVLTGADLNLDPRTPPVPVFKYPPM